jgi:hypothetical protein
VNRVDAVTLLILALYGFTGYRRGFLAVALDWLGLARAYFAMNSPGHRADILNPATITSASGPCAHFGSGSCSARSLRIRGQELTPMLVQPAADQAEWDLAGAFPWCQPQ